MRSILIFILLSATGLQSIAQTKTIQIPVYGDIDTSSWYKWKMTDVAKMKLPDLALSSDPLHFRLWTGAQALDIWTNDFVTYKGTLSNFTSRIDDDGNKRDSFISEQIVLDSNTAKIVYWLFTSNDIFKMPSSDSIPGWNIGNDGDEFLIEYATPSFYSFKEYWSPSYFRNIKAALVFDQNVKDLDKLLEMQKRWDDFIYSLPLGHYRSGDMTVYNKRSAKDMKKTHDRK